MSIDTLLTENPFLFSKTPDIILTNARGSQSSYVVVILNSNTIDTVMLTENPFYFSRTAHIVVTNALGSQRVHVLL